MNKLFFLAFIFIGFMQVNAQSYQIALLKYNGGGDWYANPTSLPNLVEFCNEQLNTSISPEIATVEVGSEEIYNYPFLHLTGHGNIVFSSQEAENLRNYLISGGFLHIDDNYGLDEFIRPQLKIVFPELELVEIDFNHPIYHQTFDFNTGLPKIHEHDGKAPMGLGLIWEGRLICFYSLESDLGDGWEDASIHGDSKTTRLKALQMGANLIQYSFTGGQKKR